MIWSIYFLELVTSTNQFIYAFKVFTLIRRNNLTLFFI